MFGARKSWVLPAFATLITVLVGLVTAWWINGETASIWASFDLAKAGLTDEYCELNRMGDAVRQPVNAWSNLCYTFLGTWVLGWAWKDFRDPLAHNPMRRFPAMSMLVGLMLVGLGCGSFFFHASLTNLGQHFDMGFTYGLTLTLGVGAAYRLRLNKTRKETQKARWAFLGLALALAITMAILKWKVSGKIALPIMMVTGISLAVWVYFRERARFSGILIGCAVLSTIVAAVFRSIDLAKVGCNSEGLYQSHAVWHFTTGLAAFLFLAFLREEKAAPASK